MQKVYEVEDGYAIRGIAPPDLARQPESVRLMFWGWVVEEGLKQKDRDLSRGLDKDGKPLKPISAATRKHRHSEMTPTGKGDPSAPPLEPGRKLSRVRSLLTGRAGADHAEFWWKFDPFTHGSFAKILYHQQEQGRDVFGLSPAALKRVTAVAWDKYKRWQQGRPVEMPREILVPQAPAKTPTILATGKARSEDWTALFRQTMKVEIPGRPAGPYNRILGHIWGDQGPPLTMAKAALRPAPKPRPAAPKKSRPVAPPQTFEEAIRAATRPLKTLDEIYAALGKLIDQHAVQGPTGAFHGMSAPATFQTIRFWGIDWHFEAGARQHFEATLKDFAVRAVRGDGVELAALKDKIPARLIESTKGIYFTTQNNRDDDYWRSKYKDFDRTGRTGGDGNIVAYDTSIPPGSLVHESGHNLAFRLYGSPQPGGDYGRMIASTAEPAVSEYAKNAPAEDFAEACRLYFENRGKMEREFPVRYKLIHKIMTDPSYGG